MKTFHFSEHGNLLGTRLLGKKIREEILQEIEFNNKVVFDFEGVEIISNSFADECFGKLLLTHDLNTIKLFTTFTNVNKTIVGVVKYAIKQREAQIEAA